MDALPIEFLELVLDTPKASQSDEPHDIATWVLSYRLEKVWVVELEY